jgi:hypothetical protein
MRRAALVAATSALALAAIPSATGAGSNSFADTIGDGNGAADVKTVVVSNDDAGQVTIRVNVDSLPNPSATTVFVLFDTDRNQATGWADGAGVEYGFVDDESNDSYSFLHWNGTDWDDAPDTTARVSSDSGGVTFSINRSELGGTTAFDFWVRTRLGDPGGAAADTAPDGDAVWSYTLQMGAPAAPKITGVMLPTASVLPKAGKTFTFRVGNVVLSTKEIVSPDRVTCKAVLAGKTLGAVGPGGCTWRLPRTARGKSLVVTFTVTYQGASYARRFPMKVS